MSNHLNLTQCQKLAESGNLMNLEVEPFYNHEKAEKRARQLKGILVTTEIE